jgi:hypothetical protein
LRSSSSTSSSLAAIAVWGYHASGIALAVAATAAWVAAWFLFAAPGARFGGRVVRLAGISVRWRR